MSNEALPLLRLRLQHKSITPKIPITAIPAKTPPIIGIIFVLEAEDSPFAVDFCSAEEPGDEPEAFDVIDVLDGAPCPNELPSPVKIVGVGEGCVSLRATPLVVLGRLVGAVSLVVGVATVDVGISFSVLIATVLEVSRTIGNANTGEVVVANVVGTGSRAILLDEEITASGVVT